MSTEIINATIEILGKMYPIRCPASELSHLQQAAQYLNEKMSEVQDAGKVINLERIAIITGLNITHQFLQLDQQKTSLMDRINQRITHLHEKLDSAISRAKQTELIYTAE